MENYPGGHFPRGQLSGYHLKYPDIPVSPQITLVISNITIEFYAFYIYTAHIESMHIGRKLYVINFNDFSE